MKKEFYVTTYDDRIEIVANHPLWNRIRMAWGLIIFGCFKVTAPTETVIKKL